MVLLAELLLAVGVLFGVYRVATRPADGMAPFEPDRSPSELLDGPLTADELVTMHLPVGVGYRKVDVDRLLDRIARQLPRAVYEPAAAGPGPSTAETADQAPAEGPREASESSPEQTDPHLSPVTEPAPLEKETDGG